MYVVIFRARCAQLDEDYYQWAARMRTKALGEYGCVEFVSLQEGDEEISLSYWPDTQSISAWRADLEHQEAQVLGRQKWYAAYQVEVAQVQRLYKFPPEP